MDTERDRQVEQIVFYRCANGPADAISNWSHYEAFFVSSFFVSSLARSYVTHKAGLRSASPHCDLHSCGFLNEKPASSYNEVLLLKFIKFLNLLWNLKLLLLKEPKKSKERSFLV